MSARGAVVAWGEEGPWPRAACLPYSAVSGEQLCLPFIDKNTEKMRGKCYWRFCSAKPALSLIESTFRLICVFWGEMMNFSHYGNKSGGYL